MQLTPAHAGESQATLLTRLLPKLSERSRQTLLRLLNQPGFSGHLPAAEVNALLESEQKSLDALMLALLPLAQSYSRPPISNYHVGAVVRGASGGLYLGVNIEIPGHSLGFSVHAEQSALSNAYMHVESGVPVIAVTAAPCGHCRQFMKELSPQADIRIVLEGNAALPLSSLLPMAFGPADLGIKDGPFPVGEVDLTLPKGTSDELSRSALQAARKSYAPYTKSYSGVAIGTASGRVYKGSYIENAAFNPSLPPLQTALAALIVAGEDYSAISRVTLVEVGGAAISQKSVAEATLSAVAPKTNLRVLTAEKTN